MNPGIDHCREAIYYSGATEPMERVIGTPE